MGAGRVVNEEVSVGAVPASEVSRSVIAAGEATGYDVTATGPSQFTLTRQVRAGWVVPLAIVLALFTFGVGLLLLVAIKKEPETCSVRVAEVQGGTNMSVVGVASSELLAAFARIGGRQAPPEGSAPPSVASQPASAAQPVVPSKSAPTPPAPGVSQQSRMASPPQPPPGSVVRPPPGSPSPTEPDVRPMLRVGGVSYPLHEGLVIGRNPMGSGDFARARPVAIPDRSLSKTHCAVRVRDGIVEVCDLSSTNGTAVVRHGAIEQCTPGVWVPLRRGDEVKAGDQACLLG